MLELFGSGYVIEHCVSAFLEDRQEKAYKTYVTDALRAIFQCVSGSNDNDSTRWIDLVDVNNNGTEKTEKNSKSCEEIVDDIWSKIERGI